MVDGRWLLIALIKIGKLGVVDLKSMEMVRSLDVPKAPQEVLVRPDGVEAYVSCDASHQVAVLDLRNWKVAKLIDTGLGPTGSRGQALRHSEEEKAGQGIGGERQISVPSSSLIPCYLWRLALNGWASAAFILTRKGDRPFGSLPG